MVGMITQIASNRGSYSTTTAPSERTVKPIYGYAVRKGEGTTARVHLRGARRGLRGRLRIVSR